MPSTRYTKIQICSVILVMLGVIITTLSASTLQPSHAQATAEPFTLDVYVYSKGIFILSVSLVLSGFLGLLQDRAHAQYTRLRVPPAVDSPRRRQNGSVSQSQKEETGPAWQESMFYLHFLALPMFFFIRKDISTQLDIINLGPVTSLPLPHFLSFSPTNYPSTLPHPFTVPTAYIPLLANACTQLLCVAGVNRLTTHMSSLTVTLVLAVRKATSLVVSAVFLRPTDGGLKMMWIGAALVMIGTVGYSVGSGGSVRSDDVKIDKLAAGAESKSKSD
jgi:UDP-xylose/UDP-N-acetylglucosamine transporter B4